ncbi:hypothetical protein [Burkholderia gladioli]|uniref:hypothetical protein n=1 Tax=Burkholderia gladioli TaxID=28095 RepID=UPI0005A6BF75|nr:hypothetical protein [Burkholderia gladioli]ASD83678.1 hypothetical protein CEJ98_33085 [Burkholderia gladioli pv. gladioli]AWY51104.1 hypothetical protein A8H28_07855 [Burkholderia gladioli pv. gladioli]PRG90692.1 hypothetical protein C6V08_31510 [Burkholderia gladioli]
MRDGGDALGRPQDAAGHGGTTRDFRQGTADREGSAGGRAHGPGGPLAGRGHDQARPAPAIHGERMRAAHREMSSVHDSPRLVVSHTGGRLRMRAPGNRCLSDGS